MSERKRWLVVASFVMGLSMVLFLPMAAQAQYYPGWFDDLDPAEWLKYEDVVTTFGSDTSFFYSPSVPGDASSYEYKADITRIEAQLSNFIWLDVTGEFGNPGDAYVEGFSGLPIPIYSESVNEPGVLTLSLDHGVIEDAGEWKLNTSLTGITFGSFGGAPITGFRATFQTGIRPVPEPGTFALLGGGMLLGLGFWWRRRK